MRRDRENRGRKGREKGKREKGEKRVSLELRREERGL